MTTYLIRQDSKFEFTVSKWEMSATPTEIYRVELHETKRARCNCMSGTHRGYCKHMDMVRAWIKRGMPMEEIAS